MTRSAPRRVELPRGALARLARRDEAFARVVATVGPFGLERGRSEGHLAALVRSIVYQQLSGKAAATIHGRVRALFDARRYPTAAELLAKPDSDYRACGLSRQKVSYLRDLCTKVDAGELKLASLARLDDEAATEAITRVRGFGRWSAEMFLIFHLGRLDVWPVDDLGVRKGAMRMLAKDELPERAEMEALGERFRPHRTVVAWYLWRLLDATAPTL